MKSWFAKFRLSQALDKRGSSAAKAAENSAVSSAPSGVHRFERQLLGLDQQLKAARPSAAAPETLHPAVMRAVRAASHEQTRQPQRRTALIWLPVPALALVAFVGVWWSVQQTAVHAPSLGSETTSHLTAAATTTLNLGQRVTQEAPTAALAPLEQELQLFRHDLKQAAELAMASLP